MVKSSFQQIYQKSVRFYDFHYHLHKSSFKSLGNIMKQYSEYQRDYASNLLKVTQKIRTQIPDLNNQMFAVKNTIKDIIQNVSTFSQLHFNYSQRLRQVSNSFTAQYLSSKKLKDKHMKVIKQQFSQNIQKARESKDKKRIIEQQAHICKTLYKHLDIYSEQQAERTQKFKQQVLIYLAFTKKIIQKQLQIASKYKTKVSQQQIQIKNQQISSVSQSLVQQYNSYYPSDENNPGLVNRLSPKNYDRVQPLQLNRQSLRQSTILKEKVNNVNNFNNKMKEYLGKYNRIPQQLRVFHVILQEKDDTQGLFNKKILKRSHLYSSLFKTDIFQQIAFDMISSYQANNKNSQKKLIINTIKGNLKIRHPSLDSYLKNLTQFIKYQQQKKSQMQMDQKKNKSNKDYLFHLNSLLLLNQIYWHGQQESTDPNTQIICNQHMLIDYLKKNIFDLNSLKYRQKTHITISSVLIKFLISSLIIVSNEQPLILDEFSEYLVFIEQFALSYFGINSSIVKIMFLNLLQNAIRSTKSNFIEQICTQIIRQSKSNKSNERINPDHIQFIKYQIAMLIVKITQGTTIFFSLPIPLINFFQIFYSIQKQSSDGFSAVQYFHKCIKKAGFKYVFWIDEDKKIIQPNLYQGQIRLKNLVEVFEKLQYKTINDQHLEPTAREMAKILGVQHTVILKKMQQQFIQALGEIIQNNLNLLSQQQGVDKDGYILKLGVFLAETDIPSYKSIDFQQKYFKVLDRYLSSTQKQYNTLLEHSRKTQIWIMEDNSLATQNCIDFCSLLYRPFEFLLSSLKMLGQQKNTKFTQQFSQFIKNRFNNVLKQQIKKYISFLDESLKIYNYEQPQIHYKLKRMQNIIERSSQQVNKSKFQFKQVVRRILNLKFLKQQLNEIINDFLDQQVNNDLGGSVFNLEKLGSTIMKHKNYRQILNNLMDIVIAIQNMEEQLTFRISDITVYHFMRHIFHNLYFQQEKSAFEEFFGTKNDYKFSSFTFVKLQNEIQQLFVLIDKFIPEDNLDKYYDRLASKFFKALKSEILNSQKFKIPRTKQQIVRYLDQDTTFICTFLKQKYIPPKFVEQNLEKPIQKVLSSLKINTKDLMQQYEQETLKGNHEQCKFILIMLYLRPNDDKAQQFFKRYKTIVFK